MPTVTGGSRPWTEQEGGPTHRFGDEQKVRYKARNVVERCLNRLKQWRGVAMRSDKLARNYRAAICLAAILIWIKTDSINTA
ncbi:transposase [Rhodococcus marinonascens]|uniref:transposase n=1 Tax=Rhodococcus marinonascens TaxID=38311 RepID=UPI000AACD599